MITCLLGQGRSNCIPTGTEEEQEGARGGRVSCKGDDGIQQPIVIGHIRRAHGLTFSCTRRVVAGRMQEAETELKKIDAALKSGGDLNTLRGARAPGTYMLNLRCPGNNSQMRAVM